MVIPGFNTLAGKDLTLPFNESGLILGLVGITLFVGIVFGTYPEFFLSGFLPGAVLKESVKTGGGMPYSEKPWSWYSSPFLLS